MVPVVCLGFSHWKSRNDAQKHIFQFYMHRLVMRHRGCDLFMILKEFFYDAHILILHDTFRTSSQSFTNLTHLNITRRTKMKSYVKFGFGRCIIDFFWEIV